ncbi:MAG: sigma-70 family RNA polymerase sigma factor [Deltaproteobacteria bacterium]|nr:sigma-70 family RNA polymerase sigma factor [Deltaproteobacteria bacterium]
MMIATTTLRPALPLPLGALSTTARLLHAFRAMVRKVAMTPESRERLDWEGRIIARVLAGEVRAFGELYAAYAPSLFSRVLMPRLGNRAAAEDALSETFRVALERLGQYRPDGKSVYRWLSRIAANKAMDMHRVKARTSRALVNFEGLLGPLREDQGPTTELEESQERARLTAQVGEALGALNPRYRRAIELRFFEARERADCAQQLEVKLGTFDVLLLRALRSFRKAWEQARATEEST